MRINATIARKSNQQFWLINLILEVLSLISVDIRMGCELEIGERDQIQIFGKAKLLYRNQRWLFDWYVFCVIYLF